MTPDREAQLEALFTQLASLPPARRRDRLGVIGSEDPQLRRELEELLAADVATSVLDEPIPLDTLRSLSADDAGNAAGPDDRIVPGDRNGPGDHTSKVSPVAPGDRIGPYHVLRVLGSGGMGEVLLAQQNEPVERQVALKILHIGMESREVLARFDAERQALALLESPHVARILDVGTSDDGRAWFALEAVDGVPITEYCASHRLGIRERLRLFLQVCRGIEDAHQRGVIHRDIKPGNILVATDRNEPMVKIIDFGIAKLTQHASGETVQGMVLGTPEYMSPEQARSGGADVDTRSDVYSAGMVLFELLVGDLPFDRQSLRAVSTVEALQRRATLDNPRPSDRVPALDEQQRTALRQRGMTMQELQRRLRGELDWICQRALDRDRTQRYQSISEFAEDVRRVLEGEPVQARPPGLGYRLRKFAAKNRAIVATTVIVLLVLIGAAVTSSVFYLREQQAHQRALTNARRAQAATRQSERSVEFLRRVLVEMNAAGASGEPETLEDAIANALEELDGADMGAAERASAKHEIAGILIEMQFRSMAKLVFESALEDFSSAEPDNAFEHATCLLELAALRTRFARDPDVTRELLDRAMELERSHLDPDTFASVAVRMKAVEILSRAQEEKRSEALLRSCIETFRRHRFPDDQPQAAQAHHLALLTLSEKMRNQERLSEAVALLEEAAEVARRSAWNDPMQRLLAHRRMASLLMEVQRYPEAAAHFDSTLQWMRRVRGDAPLATARTRGRLGLALAHAGQEDAARRHLSAALSDCEDDPACATAFAGQLRWFLGEFHRLRGEKEEALASYDRAEDWFDRRWPRGDTLWHARVRRGRASLTDATGGAVAAASPTPAGHGSPGGRATGAPSNADPANQAFLYGRLLMRDGNEYEGFLRWGSEECFWDDLFHAMKETLPYLEEHRGDEVDRRDRSELAIARWKVRTSYEASTYSRLLIARYGDIASIDVYGDDRARVHMRSGEEHEVSGGTNDVNGNLQVQDVELGDLEVAWRQIRRIDFMQAPAGLPAPDRRLYGRMRTSSGGFEGYVQWDRQECLGSDILNGLSGGEDLEIPMGSIRSIERYSEEACTVVLQDGSEILLNGANDVDARNRGIMVEDSRFGRLSVPWSEFESIEFLAPEASGPGYEDYEAGGALHGVVTAVDGTRHNGEIVFDLDEAKAWEMLGGYCREIDYQIPFANVTSITRTDEESSHVVLRNGEELELRNASDVTDINNGVLVIQAGDWENPLYLSWPRVARIDFVH